MENFVILTDACSDMDKPLREKYGIEYIPMTITRQNTGEDYVSSLDWDSFSPTEFYDMMRNGAVFKTSLIPAAIYEEHFDKYLSEGKDILVLTTSSGLSASHNSAVNAAKTMCEKYIDRKIIVVDTLRGSLGEGLICILASEKRASGMDIENVAAWVEENKLNIHQVGTVEDLVYLKRAGRVTGTAAFMSKILKIKPIIIANKSGQNESIIKVCGRKTSLQRIVNFTKEHITDPQNQVVYLVHADCIQEAEEVKNALIEQVKVKDVYINYVGPIIGATVGPGMLGIYFYGVKISAE